MRIFSATILALFLLGLVTWAGLRLFPEMSRMFSEMAHFFDQDPPPPGAPTSTVSPVLSGPLTREQIKSMLPSSLLHNPAPGPLTRVLAQETLTFKTGLDPGLQQFVLDEIKELKTLTRAKPEIIAMVAMAPDTGKILAMAGYDRTLPDINPCIAHGYPAASIFKIITASAVLEHQLMGPDTQLFFNGGKYTLYKRQLKEVKNKYTSTTTLEKAFSQSINPVFGKLGTHELGPEKLTMQARQFGFNQELIADFHGYSGSMTVTEKPYQWAEVASGFNKTTTISPLFGAMITATLLNQGNIPVPYLVESISTHEGNIIYNCPNPAPRRAVPPATAATVMEMMTHTISTGTAKKAFRNYKKDAVLTRLIMGGKTGSLYNRDHTIKLDWFTGFAREKDGNQQIVVAILVGHGEYIGTRAGTFAKKIFQTYFGDYFTSTKQ
ncbi:hypothetical protein JCM12294_01170 [Desulfocicer niacini]